MTDHDITPDDAEYNYTPLIRATAFPTARGTHPLLRPVEITIAANASDGPLHVVCGGEFARDLGCQLIALAQRSTG